MKSYLKPDRLLPSALLLISGSASAALYDYGNGMVYDSTLNITWMKDANLLGTQLSTNESLVNEIIAANNGSIGARSLTSADFGAAGKLSWWGAKAYMNYLNSIEYKGVSTWRLAENNPINGNSWSPTGPATYDGSSDFGYHISSPRSEMAFLYGQELNNDAAALFTTTGANNPAWTGNPLVGFQNAADNNAADSFQNVIAASYWSNTEYPHNAAQAWRFSFQYGVQGFTSKTNNTYYAWAVAPGNVAAVPIPAAMWLFGSALVGLVGLRRRPVR